MNLEYTRNKNFPVIEEATNPRKQRAEAMMKMGLEPRFVKEGVYFVPSQSKKGDGYLVMNDHGRWYCSCPDRLWRRSKCKHIFLFQMWSQLKQTLLEHAEEIPIDINAAAKDALYCKYCNSTSVVKNGSRRTRNGDKTRYLCRACSRTFVVVDEGFGERFDPHLVTLCLDLFFKGTSLRKIQNHVRMFHQSEIHWTTIGKWVRKYSEIIDAYVSTLKPLVGGSWGADEMMIKLKENGGEWGWSWNVIDEETRFLLSTLISKKRGIAEARMAFRRAKEQAKARPREVTTDGLWSYMEAFRKEFYAKRGTIPKLNHNAGPNGAENNNKVERLHGTIREREKILRALSNDKSSEAFMRGFKNYYNFIRPHQALKDKTPAEAAGLHLELGENKWKGLIEKAIKHRAIYSVNAVGKDENVR